MSQQLENRIENISSLIKTASRNLRKAQLLMNSLRDDVCGSYDDVPGVLGIFDGEFMITPEGKKYEVNPNYSAKSMLVVGDNLKMVEEGDKQLFKQISKVPRRRVEGVLNKKEGKWYAITDVGSYKVLDVAVDFRRGAVNDEVFVVVPEDNLDTAYAALEKLGKEEERPIIDEPEVEEKAPKVEKKIEKKEEKPEKKKAPAKPKKETKKKEEKKPEKKKAPAKPKKETKKKVEKKEEKKEEKPKEDTVDSILEGDDLR
jgi:Mg-chelatase subunit ChlI